MRFRREWRSISERLPAIAGLALTVSSVWFFAPPGFQGYNGMVYTTTDIPLEGGKGVFLATGPQNASRFSQIELPMLGIGGADNRAQAPPSPAQEIRLKSPSAEATVSGCPENHALPVAGKGRVRVNPPGWALGADVTPPCPVQPRKEQLQCSPL
jgi:hypothetical protein